MSDAKQFEGTLKNAVAQKAAEQPTARRRGRPRKLAVVRDEQVASTRQPASGRATAIGRDGKILTRKRTSEGDKFAIPQEIVPDGWTYEWKRKSVFGQEDQDHLTGLMENGWTPVPADRHAGQFMVRKGSGEIVRDGLILMERPKALTDEARSEEKQNARLLVHLQNEQYRTRMPSGMDASHPDARVRLNQTYEKANPDLRPSYQVARD